MVIIVSLLSHQRGFTLAGRNVAAGHSLIGGPWRTARMVRQ
jgi:hypothetical protein